MAYDTYMASYLSGATVDQLRRWARNKILVPEVNDHRPLFHSFCDIVAFRAVAKLRAFTSLQRISKALKPPQRSGLHRSSSGIPLWVRWPVHKALDRG